MHDFRDVCDHLAPRVIWYIIHQTVAVDDAKNTCIECKNLDPFGQQTCSQRANSLRQLGLLRVSFDMT
jgi:hypothetical protein